jgi:hypothetical protein
MIINNGTNSKGTLSGKNNPNIADPFTFDPINRWPIKKVKDKKNVNDRWLVKVIV